MDISVGLIRKLDKVEPQLREVLLSILEEMEKQRKERVTKEEFRELRDIVKELAQAQKKTEERMASLEMRMEELAQAQKETEKRMATLEKRMEELAQAQKKTEERMASLEMRMEELAQAQKETEKRMATLEKRMEELAQAQRRTEERLNELAQAQRKTEEELKKLIGEHRKTREQLGGLSHTVGYVLEDRAYRGLPPLLKRDFGVEITEPLHRDFIEVGIGRYEEVNLIGKGRKDGKEVIIVGDCKTQMKKKDIDSFLRVLQRIENILKGEKIVVGVTYQATIPVRKYAEEKGIKLYFSYEFPL